MSDELKSCSGTVEKLYYYSPESGWAAFSFRLTEGEKNDLEISKRKKTIRCSGEIPEIRVGESLTLHGQMEDSKYGLQLKVKSFEEGVTKKAETPTEVLNILLSGTIKGVGKVTASRIFEKFKDKSLVIIEEDYERLTEVEGIGKKKAESIHKNYVTDNGIRKIIGALAGYGVTTGLAFKLFQKWGLDCIDIVKTNPYLMADPQLGIEGIGFKRADEIGSRLGIEKNSPLRLQSLIAWLLTNAAVGDGHIFFSYDELLKLGKDFFIGITQEEIRENLAILKKNGKIVIDGSRIYAANHYYREVFNAQSLVVLQNAILKDCVLNFDAIQKAIQSSSGRPIVYDESQRAAIEMAAQDTTGVMILTGSPGSGKTTVTKGIIEMLSQSGYEILCAAPTGRAAKRMKEATGHDATTIHRLLGYGHEGFTYNATNKLECDALIIDESSMIDNELLYHLLSAVEVGTKVLFIGDIDQLPSIGAGNILRDMIASEYFPVCSLKYVHRQGNESMIIVNANAINEGRGIRTKNTEETDCVFVNLDQFNGDPNAEVDAIVNLVSKKIPAKHGYNPKDIQVLSPMKGYSLGIDSINEALQQELNESSRCVKTGSTVFYVGDKVMQLRNNRDKGVFNGDIGTVYDINHEEKEVIVLYPDYDDPYSGLYVAYDFRELDQIKLAYACTIHKSQGSEYPAVVLIVSNQHYYMLQRNLVYTGLTRAKKLCYVLGTDKAIYRAANNVPVHNRNTTLIERIYAFAETLDEFEEEDDDFEME